MKILFMVATTLRSIQKYQDVVYRTMSSLSKGILEFMKILPSSFIWISPDMWLRTDFQEKEKALYNILIEGGASGSTIMHKTVY